jgi:hypothetical protein
VDLAGEDKKDGLGHVIGEARIADQAQGGGMDHTY